MIVARRLCGFLAWVGGGIFCLVFSVAAAGPTAPQPPALLLAETYRPPVDLALYLVSEKFDGVRAYWDGRQLLSRGGQVIAAPAWFVAPLPARALDGELWLGYGRFEEISGLSRRTHPEDGAWRDVRYLLFELPGAEGRFDERVTALQAVAAQAGAPWIVAVAQFRLADHRALMSRLKAVVKAGGEGLMLHRADAPYTTGRSEVLLKVKDWHDAEARVIAHLPGKGKYRGMLGALRVRTDDGREFSLGTGFTDQLRREPPPIGSRVTYRYRELTAGGLPRFARFWRLREVQ